MTQKPAIANPFLGKACGPQKKVLPPLLALACAEHLALRQASLRGRDSARAAIQNVTDSGLEQQQLILQQFWRAEGSPRSTSGEARPPGLQVALLLCPHTAPSLCMCHSGLSSFS